MEKLASWIKLLKIVCVSCLSREMYIETYCIALRQPNIIIKQKNSILRPMIICSRLLMPFVEDISFVMRLNIVSPAVVDSVMCP